MENYTLTINGKTQEVSAEPDMPLLWVLRDFLNMKGTKFGCGQALCGACTVHLDEVAVRSCSLPISEVKDGKITNMKDEGLVLDVYKEIHDPETFMGNSAIGHTRYTTAGDKKKYNFQL